MRAAVDVDLRVDVGPADPSARAGPRPGNRSEPDYPDVRDAYGRRARRPPGTHMIGGIRIRSIRIDIMIICMLASAIALALIQCTYMS